MWNIANRMGLRSHPVAPVQKQGFHTIIPIMTGLPSLPVMPDKRFTNPNYVNPKNPSVLGYDTFKTVQYHNNPIEIDVKPQQNLIIQPEIIHKENSSVVLLDQSTEETNSLPEKEVEEEKSVAAKPSTQPVSMCIGARKRRRKNRRNRRRKQRDNPKNPGKHCKNLDKEQKHSKIAEQQQIIKEELEIECDDITMMSCQSAVDNALDNSLENLRKHDHFPQLSDFIPKVTENEHIITETTPQHPEENSENKIESEDWESMSDDEEQTVEDGEYSDVDEVDNVMCFTISFNPNCQRKIRQISVTESEDSFIVFDSGTEEESDFFEDDDDEDEESDIENVETEIEETDSDFTSSSSVIPSKKVRFADDSVLCSVQPMVKWAYAYQAARKGPWEEYARDRERFRKRISDTERVLSSVFHPQHRKKVYDERFTPPTVDVPMEI